MSITKIPSQASVRRALTTLKKGGYIMFNLNIDLNEAETVITMKIPTVLLSPKKTSRKKPKHKRVKRETIFREGLEKTSYADGDL